MFLFGTRSSNHKMASLVPVMAGVGFASVVFRTGTSLAELNSGHMETILTQLQDSF
jgi:hypothetical protein